MALVMIPMLLTAATAMVPHGQADAVRVEVQTRSHLDLKDRLPQIRPLGTMSIIKCSSIKNGRCTQDHGVFPEALRSAPVMLDSDDVVVDNFPGGYALMGLVAAAGIAGFALAASRRRTPPVDEPYRLM